MSDKSAYRRIFLCVHDRPRSGQSKTLFSGLRWPLFHFVESVDNQFLVK
ncbi:hypothetical protein DES34_101302 [Brevibacillus brevis]|nr:hypothetical protein DES34_101302 [Brevibacillus brevis]VEF89246.1 Uncharacterised protein [Brevibacillus brevis]